MAIDSKYGRVTLEKGTIGEDEPVVVFRSQDRLLPRVLEYYADLCREEGSPPEHLEGLQASRQRVLDWQGTHHTQTPQSAPVRGEA